MRQKKHERVPYSKEEIKLITENKGLKLRDIANMIGREYDSVRRKKWQLDNMGRDMEIKYRYKKKVQEELSNGERQYMIWSPAEEEEIMTTTLTDKELAIKLGRTVGSIQVKRNRMLKKGKR